MKAWLREFGGEFRADRPGKQVAQIYYVLAVIAVAGSALAGMWRLAGSPWLPLSPSEQSSKPPQPDLEVSAFGGHEGNQEIDYIRNKIERNFVDLFVESKVQVRSWLTAKQTIAKSHFMLTGQIAAIGGNVMITTQLSDANGTIIGSSQIEGSLNELEDIYKMIPEALMFGMGVDAETLKKSRPAVRPTSSVEAYAQFLQARREVQRRNFDAAERRLKRSIEIDSNFATAYWAVGEIKRLQGDANGALEWYQNAKQLNPDHSMPSIEAAQGSNPIPLLFANLRISKADELLTGARYLIVKSIDFDIKLHAWTFDPRSFRLKIVQQATSGGQIVDEFLVNQNDVFAINGGFFEIDSARRLTPSGLLITNGNLVSDLTDKGSGVVYSKTREVKIVPAKEFQRASVLDAVQAGPLLVDPGSKLGIYRNDFDRQSRSAVCVGSGVVTLILVEGGLSLFELGQLLARPRLDGGFGCDAALNLDGGPSTQAVFKGNGHHLSIAGRWRIQNALVISKRR
jgi:uncharacterized protein YigE (DUF2233 family)